METLYEKKVNYMELKRAIYDELIKWKQRNSGKVLELKGTRQSGKTYILDKFARENYKVWKLQEQYPCLALIKQAR